jgi:hypothetical protein
MTVDGADLLMRRRYWQTASAQPEAGALNDT